MNTDTVISILVVPLAKKLGLEFQPPQTVGDLLPDYDVCKLWAIINELLVTTWFRCAHCGEVSICKVENENDNVVENGDVMACRLCGRDTKVELTK